MPRSASSFFARHRLQLPICCSFARLQKKMKRLIVILAVLLSVGTASAQLSFGVRAGYGAYGAYFEPISLSGNQESMYQPNFGLVAIYNDKRNFGLQTELNYQIKGWREVDEDVDHSEYVHKIKYLELPIFSHIEIGRKNFRLFFIIGPYIAWRQREDVSSQNYEHMLQRTTYNHYNQTVRDLDFGNKVGGGLRYNIGRFSVFADFRYDMQVAGGQNIFKKQADKIQASRLTEISGSVGIVFNIIKQKTEEEKEYYVPKEGMDDDF